MRNNISDDRALPEELPFPLSLSVWVVVLHGPAHTKHTHTHTHILIFSSKYNKFKKEHGENSLQARLPGFCMGALLGEERLRRKKK